MVKRGDIYLVATSKDDHSRLIPMVVVSNDVGNTYAPVVTVAKMALGTKKYKTQAQVTNDGKKAVVFCDQIDTIDKERLIWPKGALSPEDMERVNDAIVRALDLNGLVMNKQALRGRIVYVSNGDLNRVGHEQKGDRPAVLVSSDLINNADSFKNYEIVYATTRDKAKLPTHVTCIPRWNGFERKSTLLCEQVSTVPKSSVTFYDGEFHQSMGSVNRALKIALGIEETGENKEIS